MIKAANKIGFGIKWIKTNQYERKGTVNNVVKS
jgi:hypothetical protein